MTMFGRFAKKINFDSIVLSSFFVVGGGTLWQAYHMTNIGDATPCGEYSPAVTPPTTTDNTPLFRQPFSISKSDLDTLNEEGIVVIKGSYFSDDQLRDMRKAVDSIHSEGRMEITSNGKGVRQDTVCWIRPTDGCDIVQPPENKSNALLDESTATSRIKKLPPCLLECISMLREVAVVLERAGYDHSFNHMVPKQCQLARYEGNMKAQYVAHRDAMAGNWADFRSSGLLGWLKTSDYRKRCVTAILYLNKRDWDCSADADGGALCCYLGAAPEDDIGSTAKNVMRVNPAGGTLVLFDSTEILHAVEPSNSCRYALTLWIIGDSHDKTVPK